MRNLTQNISALFSGEISRSVLNSPLPGNIAERFQLLELHSTTRKIIFSITNRTSFEYLFISSGYRDFYGLAENEPVDWHHVFPRVIREPLVLKGVMDGLRQLLEKFNEAEREQFSCVICGPPVTTLHGVFKRVGMQVYPVCWDQDDRVHWAGLNSTQDIKHLLGGEGFWIRVSSGDKVFTYFSSNDKITNRDIVTTTELEVIKMWGQGMDVPAIAEAKENSIHTVNNQFKSARNRLLARDNTALLELCVLAGIVEKL